MSTSHKPLPKLDIAVGPTVFKSNLFISAASLQFAKYAVDNMVLNETSFLLEMVPTRYMYKGFCARLEPCRKGRSLALNLNKNADISIFLKKKEGKDISSQVFLEFVFAYRKANAFINVLKLMVT